MEVKGLAAVQGHTGGQCVFQTFPPCFACALKEHLRRMLTKEFGISQTPTARARQSAEMKTDGGRPPAQGLPVSGW